MIIINFTKRDSLLTGFECRGHSGEEECGSDIICAFVSSACFMANNTVTEIIGLDADEAAADGYMRLNIKESPAKAQDILNGLVLHLTELQKDYPKNIKVTISEV